MDQEHTLGGGGGWKNMCQSTIILCFFGKSSLGGNLIVQLCIFSCKDEAMLGYNVLGMYLRTIGICLLALNNMWKKNLISWSAFQ